jgi:primosomal replication protein N
MFYTLDIEVVHLEQLINHITLRGTLEALPEYSHENHGSRFFRFYLLVPRLSGTIDRLPILADETTLNSFDLSAGSMLTVKGQIRSHNQRTDGVRHLLIFVFASSIVCEDGEPINDVYLEGVLCKDPTYRRTPLGRDICDVMLAVPRPFRRADYLPCILWGRTAQEASQCLVRDRICIQGRLQSRNYTKSLSSGTETRTAYEISALTAQFPEEDQ